MAGGKKSAKAGKRSHPFRESCKARISHLSGNRRCDSQGNRLRSAYACCPCDAVGSAGLW
jgi:hypothetical protein